MSAAAGPLTILESNPIYFTADGSNAVFLAGPHTWANLQDFGGSQPDFDFAQYLDLLTSYGLNMIRLWCWPGAMNSAMTGLQPHPWLRTGPGNGNDGGLRFNVEQYDIPAFTRRLQSRVAQAGEAGIYVMAMLTNWYSSCAGTSAGCENGFQYLPSNTENNINGVDDPLIGTSAGLTEFQKIYIRHFAQWLKNSYNVIWEIGNEIPEAGISWETAAIRYLREYESSALPNQHLIGVNSGYGTGGASVEDLISTGADFISLPWPDAHSFDPPKAEDRPTLADTDHMNYPLNTSRPAVKVEWAWKSFTRGMHPLDMEMIQVALPGYPGEPWNNPNNPAFPAARQAMSVVSHVAQHVPLASMTPQNGSYTLATGPRASEPCWVAYSTGGDITLSGLKGTLWWQTIDLQTGATGTPSQVTGPSQTFPGPPHGDWAMVVSTQNPPIPPMTT